MEQKPLSTRWKAKVSASLERATPDQIWPLFKDFFNLHKWFPTLSTCYGIHGTNGEPGCIRFCAGFSIQSNGRNHTHKASDNSDKPFSWSKERLIAVDDADRSLSYEIVECNIGFKSYVSTIEICRGHDGQRGCVIQWCFAVDPVDGLAFDDLVKKYETGLERMASRMEDAVVVS